MEKKSDIEARLQRLESSAEVDYDEDKWQTYLMDYTLNRAHLGGYNEVFWRISLSRAYCKFRGDTGIRERAPTFQELKEVTTDEEYDDLVRTLEEMKTLAEQLKDDAFRVYQTTRSWHLTPEEEEERKRLRDKKKPLVVADGKARREDQTQE